MFRLLMLLVLSLPLQAEELPTLGLGDLVYYSPVIFSGRLLPGPALLHETREGYYHLRYAVVERIIRGGPLPDTVAVETGSYQLEDRGFSQLLCFGYYEMPTYPHHPRVFQPFLSGIRPFQNDTVYTPFQPENPGDYRMIPSIGPPVTAWIGATEDVMLRFGQLETLRLIPDPKSQNEALFQWINQQRHCYFPDTNRYKLPWHDCDWGPYSYQVFRWINGNGIWQDTWRSILLSVELMPEYGYIWHGPEGAPPAFVTPDARVFLMDNIRHNVHLDICLLLLSESLWSWDHDTPATQEEYQAAVTLMIPMLDQPDTRMGAFYGLNQAILHHKHPWKDQAGAAPLSAIRDVQEKVKNQSAHSEADLFFLQRIEHLLKEKK